MIRVAVCEDEPMQAELIVALLRQYKAERPGVDMTLRCFPDADTLLNSVGEGEQYDVFLLDILLPGMNGIDLAKELRRSEGDAALVFLTSTVSYAFDAFKVSAAQYILKPIMKDDLFPVLDHILTMHSQEKERFFMLSSHKSTVKIPYGSIMCIELSGRSMKFYLENGETLQSTTIRVSFGEAISCLLEDKRFLWEHKSYVLNMAHVQEIGSASFVLTGGVEVPIPKYNFAGAKAKYFAWLKSADG